MKLCKFGLLLYGEQTEETGCKQGDQLEGYCGLCRKVITTPRMRVVTVEMGIKR